MAEKIKAAIVIEMMGRPAEHLRGVMKDFLKKLSEEKGISINGKKVHSPKKYEQKNDKGEIVKMPEGKEIYSMFTELELSCDQIFDLIRIVYIYMPSHVEITAPKEFAIKNFDLASILNEMAKKLHQYDAIAKNALMQNQMLANRLMQMQEAMKAQGVVEDENSPSLEIVDKTEIKPIKTKADKKKKSAKKKHK